jgi:ABC-type multidrug transport system permease subunit
LFLLLVIEFRAVFILETKNNFYHVSPYVLAHYLVGLPGIGVIALVSSALIYYPAGMHDGRFFVFFLNLFLSLTTAEAFMSFMSAIAPHYIVGMAVAAGVYGMFMLSQVLIRFF